MSSQRRLPAMFYQEWFLAFLFFTATGSLMLFPIFPNFFDKLVAGGDAYEYVWKLWWFKQSLLTGKSPWIVPDIYYPHGYLLAYGEITPANTFFALPLVLLLGEIATYNALVLFSTILSGFAMFLLAREVSGSFWAGLLAGVIFAFAPFRRLHILHLNIFTTLWLPLLFYFLERFARSRKPVFGLAAGVCFALNALASWYYAMAAVIFVVIWSLVRFRPYQDYLRQKQTWLAFIGMVGVGSLLILPFMWPYLSVVGNSDITIPMENSNFYSASFVEYLLPSPFHFLWGSWVYQNLMGRPAPGEFILGVGFVGLLFGFYGFRYARRQATLPWLIVLLVAVVLSFGLTLHIIGRQIALPAPQGVVDAYNQAMNTISLDYAWEPEPFTIGQDDGLVIPLPALFMRWFVPVIGKMRTWTRLGIIALFALAVLAALGAAAWHRREIARRNNPPSKQRRAWMIVIGLALFELWWAPLAMHEPILERPVDRWLAAQPGQHPIIQYPLESAFTARQFLYARSHGKPIIHGYATYFSFVFSRQHPELLTFPNSKGLRQLADWDVQYVLIETAGAYADEAQAILEKINQESCLQLHPIQGSVYVVELVNCGRSP